MFLKIFNSVRFIVAMLLFLGMGYTTYHIVDRSSDQQQRKYDDSNINHMKYGMFNVNIWKDKLSAIVVQEIEEFKVESSNKKDLKRHVESQLSSLIDKVDAQIRDSNRGSAKGWLKQRFMEAFVDVDDIKEGIPNYADSIVQQMTAEDSQRKLKDVIKQRISKYLDETFEPQDLSEINGIIARTGKSTREEALAYFAEKVPSENRDLYLLTWVLIALAAGLFMVSAYHRSTFPPAYFLLCLGTLIVLLYAGVTCPMIDMEAKISKFSFMLLGHPVEFNNQVVYFQSKSILDVFFLLMADPDIQMKIVGILMVLFSIVFPVFKMVSSVFYYYNILRAQESRWVKFFVLKSGKWSMTDVQIVAIMMAYIGFNGMVTSQFNTLRQTIPQFVLISTNGTTLQIGFYIFLAYVILAMFLSGLIEKKSPHRPHNISPKNELKIAQ